MFSDLKKQKNYLVGMIKLYEHCRNFLKFNCGNTDIIFYIQMDTEKRPIYQNAGTNSLNSQQNGV